MVHLSSIKSPDAAEQKAQTIPEDRTFSTTVYGSKQAAGGLPTHEMPGSFLCTAMIDFLTL